MKTNILNIVIFILCSQFAEAQSLSIWSFYHTQSRSATTHKFMIPGLLIKSSSLFVDDSDAKFFLKKLGKIRVIIKEKGEDLLENSCYNRFVRKLKRDRFEDFLAVREKDSKVNIMVRTRGERIKGFVFLVKDEAEFVMFSAKCNFSMSDFSKFIENHQTEILSKSKSIKI